MLRPLIVCLFACLLAPLPFCCAAIAAERQESQQVVDGIAAIVNGDVITYSQVRELVGPREKLLRSQFTGEELITKIKEVRLAALRDLIDRQLIIQAFKKEGFAIPDHYVDERVNTIIRESFGGDRNAFIKTLQAQNYTLAKFKEMERDKMVVQAMRSKNVKPSMGVSPGKIEEYYAKNRQEFSSKEQVKLRMIMIPGGSASQKAIAEEIHGKLKGGAEFDRMAQMYSEDSTRDLGGDWGWIDRKTLTEPLEKVAFSLKPGEISKVVAVGPNYYILKAEARRDAVARPLAEVRPDIERKLMQAESQRLQQHWLDSLREKAYIKTF